MGTYLMPRITEHSLMSSLKIRGLHDNFDIWVFGEDLLDIPRSERSPALPHAFVLPANTNQVDVLHVLVITN